MKSPLPIPSKAPAGCVPFAQATPEQRAKAQRAVWEALQGKFPPIPKVTWANALQVLQPDLWGAPDSISLDARDLARVAHHLDALPAVITARARQGLPRLYFGRQPMNCPDEVLGALAELEADPRRAAPRCTSWLRDGPAPRRGRKFRLVQGPTPREQDGTDPDQARAALLARVMALDRARGEPGAA
ncbi:hypothetical protein [Hymenobacter sp. BRD67]|uniref:hypothetical protein n=1 Tax=Hymenobacter sp. BRD67 TaxID=2675877 RepID=UPI00156413D0|nr:hypothetical protein [Hymenobacter sp. BRD67]QKG55091.1 hypothetical protein GKZ67_21970 [Hymenobacter sp. BRD67]